MEQTTEETATIVAETTPANKAEGKVPFGPKRALEMFIRPRNALNGAASIELFFDLVIVFCVGGIFPVVSHCPADQLTWYTFYTMTFTFVLVLQIWFYVTLLMNRHGDGGPADVVCVVITMFLLFIMTHAISTGWEEYAVYNICWMLMLANLAIHWIIRYKRLPDASTDERTVATYWVLIMGIQIVLVGLSMFFPSVPAQIICALALATGFAGWGLNRFFAKQTANFHHLTERCSLLIIVVFGEVLAAIANIETAHSDLLYGGGMFVAMVFLYLTYDIEFMNALDRGRHLGGMGYMAISAWLTVWVGNITVALELLISRPELASMGRVYLSLSVTVYLLSLFGFSYYNKPGYRRTPGAIVLRTVLCLAIIAGTLLTQRASMAGFAIALVAIAAVFFCDLFFIRKRQAELGEDL